MTKLIAALAAAALTSVSAEGAAAAPAGMTLVNDQGQPMLQKAHYHRHRYYGSGYGRGGYYGRSNYACEAERRSTGNQGTVLGAVAGGLGGNLLAPHGSRGVGTLIGAGVGAVAGHQIAKGRVRC